MSTSEEEEKAADRIRNAFKGEIGMKLKRGSMGNF